jgi:hypothetical protein
LDASPDLRQLERWWFSGGEGVGVAALKVFTSQARLLLVSLEVAPQRKGAANVDRLLVFGFLAGQDQDASA